MSNCGEDERKQKSLAIAMMIMAMIIIKDCSRCEREKTTRKLLKYLNQFTFFLFQPSLFFYAHENAMIASTNNRRILGGDTILSFT